MDTGHKWSSEDSQSIWQLICCKCICGTQNLTCPWFLASAHTLFWLSRQKLGFFWQCKLVFGFKRPLAAGWVAPGLSDCSLRISPCRCQWSISTSISFLSPSCPQAGRIHVPSVPKELHSEDRKGWKPECKWSGGGRRRACWFVFHEWVGESKPSPFQTFDRFA